MERWLLISNCQTTGLSNALQMVNPNFSVTPMDIWSFSRDVEKAVASFGDYFRVVVSPEILNIEGADFSSAPNLTKIPSIYFSAYHPDCVYAVDGSGPLKGPLDAYHSLIVIAAYRRGLSQQDAISLFRGDVFERCGYMDYWQPQRDRLISSFAQHGLNIEHEVRRWGRQQAFMHTIDHPKIHCLYDVARVIMRSMGVPCVEANIIPHDNLKAGSAWAVYPEIGELLGVEGSYRFKRFGRYNHMGLEELVAESYAIYEQAAPDTVEPNSFWSEAFGRVMEAI